MVSITKITLVKLAYKHGLQKCWNTEKYCFDTLHDILSAPRQASVLFTLPQTNSKRPWIWMVGILSRFLLGPGLCSGAFSVSFRECTGYFYYFGHISPLPNLTFKLSKSKKCSKGNQCCFLIPTSHEDATHGLTYHPNFCFKGKIWRNKNWDGNLNVYRQIQMVFHGANMK